MDHTEWKKETVKQWNNKACGSLENSNIDLEYFLEVEENRYNNYGPWMKEFYAYHDHKGINLLEIGFGQGTDLVQYKKGGAMVSGVDLTPNHYELANKNFELRGLKANLFLEDASNLHFDDDTFDKVVSFGVLHHTPDIEKCISEVYRVLKPGGKFVMTLYHRNSVFFLFLKLIVDGLFHLNLFRLGYNGIKATIEKGADGKKIKPLVLVYTSKKMKKVLRHFSSVEIHKRHLKRSDFWIFGRFISDKMLSKWEKSVGWYIIGVAEK